MMPQPLRDGLLVLLAAALTACASPQTRIEHHPEVFAKATPEQQALIKKGEIAVGFTPELVRLALGKPDRITERTDSHGTETVWHYVDYSAASTGYAFYDPFWGPYWGPYWGPSFWGPAFAPVYVVDNSGREHDRIRVIFRNGKVTAIERVVKE